MLLNVPAGTAALGGGMRSSQQLYRFSDGGEEQTDVVPLYLYDGQYLFMHGTSGGIHVFSNDGLELNLLGRYRFEELDPDDDPFFDGLAKREQTLDGGVEVALRGRYGNVRVNWLRDMLDRHGGDDLEVSYRYDFERGQWVFSPFVVWSRHDERLTGYYYGVSAAEARPDLPEYRPGGSTWVSIGLDTTWWLSERVNLFGNIGFGGPDSSVTDSPLVERSTGATAFVGGAYIFGNVRQPDAFITPERRSEWSWRVNYGYQAEGNVVGDIDRGDFSENRLADTRIAGLTLGKLLSDGPRLDFHGRFALFRHFEESEGNGDFFSYAAYISAMGRGYSRWSKEEIFRWSFGFGMSYADRVEIAQQREQAAREGDTSRLLSYMEMTLDLPLARLTRSRALRNCYAGLTVVHRSGIFGSSDFLGGVSGGSDWITAHFECLRR